MQLKITADLTIGQLQQFFSGYFPFLSVRIMDNPALPLHTTLRKAGMGKWKEGILDFDPETTVAELEKTFRKKFGLKVQVFRRSGDVWLETTITDKWTLFQQNKHGEESTLPEKEIEIPDYELNRDED